MKIKITVTDKRTKKTEVSITSIPENTCFVGHIHFGTGGIDLYDEGLFLNTLTKDGAKCLIVLNSRRYDNPYVIVTEYFSIIVGGTVEMVNLDVSIL